MEPSFSLVFVKPLRYFSHSSQSPARIFSSKYFKLKKRPDSCSTLNTQNKHIWKLKQRTKLFETIKTKIFTCARFPSNPLPQDIEERVASDPSSKMPYFQLQTWESNDPQEKNDVFAFVKWQWWRSVENFGSYGRREKLTQDIELHVLISCLLSYLDTTW